VLVHKPCSIPVSALRNSPDTLKKKMGRDQLDGLRASVNRFGFCAVLNVALDPGDVYVVLDGNTRVEELRAAGITEIDCIVHPDLAHDRPDAAHLRQEFLISFDRHRKSFDKEAVISSIVSLTAAGRDASALSTLSGHRNIDRILEETKKAREAVAPAPASSTPAFDTLVLSGPADQIAAIRTFTTSWRAEANEQIVKLLRESVPLVKDEAFLAALLSAILSHEVPS
jgi:hypothetical protein